jgi:hypothetical protein
VVQARHSPSVGQIGQARSDSLDHIYLAREDVDMKKLLLLLLFGCTACTTQANDPSKSPLKGEAGTGVMTPAKPGDTLAEIRRLIGTPACSENAQCRTLPVGAAACGGPQEYLPFSNASTDEGQLRALAERSKVERQAEIKSSGEMSICIHRPDPGAVCVAGACQLGSGSPAV